MELVTVSLRGCVQVSFGQLCQCNAKLTVFMIPLLWQQGINQDKNKCSHAVSKLTLDGVRYLSEHGQRTQPPRATMASLTTGTTVLRWFDVAKSAN